MNLPTKWNRRSFLATLAAGAALSPFVPRLESHAGGSPIPKRLLVFFNSHGVAYENWQPSGGVNDFTLGSMFAGLETYRDHMVFVDGLSNEAVLAGPGKDHIRSMSTLLTGTEMSNDNDTGGESIDQVIAAAINAPNNAFRSLHSTAGSGSGNLCSRGSNEEINAETDASGQFARVFADLNLDDSQLLQLRQDRQSVIDVVREQLHAVQTSVSAQDRHKLEAHLSGIKEIEDRLATLGKSPPGCSIPAEAAGGGSMQAQGRAHMDILVSALACDVTRVAVMGYPGGQFTPNWLPGVSDVYHDICHGGRAGRPLFAEMNQLSQWFAGEFKYLLDRLASAQEFDGSSLLDHTLVIWCTNMKDGSHRWDAMPVLLVGGDSNVFDSGFGTLQTGRSLQFGGRALNDLWSTMSGLMGAGSGNFGNPAYFSGTLPGLA